MTFVPTANQKKYINIATDVLKDYKHCLHRARQMPDIGSPRITGMPTGGHDGSNHADDDIIAWCDDPNKRYCDYCKKIVKLIHDEESVMFADMLKMLYFGWNTNADVKEKYLLSKTPFYDALNKAKLVFGESVNQTVIRDLRMEIKSIRR